MFHLDLAQFVQVRLPFAVLCKIVGYPPGKEDVACVTAIHDPLRNINSCSCNICSTIYVPNFVDRSAVNPHSKLQMRILL